MEGGGADIWGTEDAFQYYYTPVSGDFDVAVRSIAVENTDIWAKAGLMVRDSLEANASNAMVRRRPNGEVSLQWRPESGGETTSAGGAEADWLRFVRSGDTLEAYRSTDGESWTTIGVLTDADIALSESVSVGLAVTSHSVGTSCTATFQGLTGIEPDSNGDIGDVAVSGGVNAQTGVPLVSSTEPTDVTATGATLRGELTDLGGADAAECYFEYREVPHESWTTTQTQTLTAAGSFAVDADGLTDRRYYEVRAVADTDDGDTATGAVVQFSTPNRSNSQPNSDAGPSSSSQFDPDDGFARAAPWLDDETPIITITEPTRDQLDRAVTVDGERLIVFETSGTVDLDGTQLTVTNDELYLAGQTAPSPGITLIGGRFFLDANDCVIQHIRIRKGDTGPTGEGPSDAVQTGDGTRNNVIDHCTATWGIDETFSVGYDTENTTVSNCLIAEALRFPYPDKDVHYGTLVGDGSENVTLVGNVWAHNTNRLPRLKAETTSVVVNNVMYHYDEATNLGETGTVYSSVVGNGYLRGDNGDTNIDGGNAYLDDNYSADPETPMTENVTELNAPPLWPDGLAALPSEELETHNLENAGARPADRTEHDERVIDQVRNRTGSFIDSQTEVGGYPDLAVVTHELTVPNGGTRAWLRSWARRVEEGS
ncbi:pectate lyase [Halocatena pleomorpha]|uniref:Pectate lyase n=1 Tax=Halocatena pleomorpha TaxID=1785090 RepID=A0A3P3RCH1_9EURY|nr:pectate lyase [Halocatena pleomorpha]